MSNHQTTMAAPTVRQGHAPSTANVDKSESAFPLAPELGTHKFINKGMSLREYAAIKLKVPDSGTDWLDEMIVKSLKDDFAAKAMQPLVEEARNPQTKTAMKRLGFKDEEFWGMVALASYKAADAMLKAREA
jgi:hypothetical protein